MDLTYYGFFLTAMSGLYLNKHFNGIVYQGMLHTGVFSLPTGLFFGA